MAVYGEDLEAIKAIARFFTTYPGVSRKYRVLSQTLKLVANRTMHNCWLKFKSMKVKLNKLKILIRKYLNLVLQAKKKKNFPIV